MKKAGLETLDEAPREEVAAPQRIWRGDDLRAIWRQPMPGQRLVGSRVMAKTLITLFRDHVIEIRGIERILPEFDPFIIAFNHNQKYEAVLVPTILIMERFGKTIHFLSDWNFRLIPVVGSYLKRSETITVFKKDAKPKFLNVFKPLFKDPLPALSRAKQRLEDGRSIGIFPEGTVNRDPKRLLSGHPGAARLSLETGVPLIPAGIRFPEIDGTRPIEDSDRMLVEIGEPMIPPALGSARRAAANEVRTWHDALMSELARLSGKAKRVRAQGEG